MADELALTPASGVRVLWDRPAMLAYARGADGAGPEWRLEGSLSPRFALLRVLSAALEDGSLLLLAAAREPGTKDHGEEHVAALVTDPSGVPEEIEEALVSTEYAADGTIRRVGLELYKPGDDFPLRGAGDAEAGSASGDDPEGRRSARLRFRLDGREGVADYEIIERV